MAQDVKEQFNDEFIDKQIKIMLALVEESITDVIGNQ